MDAQGNRGEVLEHSSNCVGARDRDDDLVPESSSHPWALAPDVDLFSPVALGDLQLANRVVMAPLTRMRSGVSGVPGDLVVEHYRQRAGVGLIVTEGTYPSAESRAYPGQPGIVDDEQAA